MTPRVDGWAANLFGQVFLVASLSHQRAKLAKEPRIHRAFMRIENLPRDYKVVSTIPSAVFAVVVAIGAFRHSPETQHPLPNHAISGSRSTRARGADTGHFVK